LYSFHRYHTNTNILLGQVRALHKWVDVAAAREEVEAAVAAFLGPKTEADLAPPEKKKKIKEKKAAPAAVAAAASVSEDAEASKNADPYAFLPKPQDNTVVRHVEHRWPPDMCRHHS
jgi:glutaminyl-tRNA synthetase